MITPTHSTFAETEAPPFEVEISYSEQEIATKLAQYGLNQTELFNQLKVDARQLQNTINTHQVNSNSYLTAIADALVASQNQRNLSEFTAYINQLVFLWLNALQNHVDVQVILHLISCLESKSLFSRANTAKLHLFLYRLWAETTHQFQQQQLDYALNFDSNTQLPNVSQIFHYLENNIKKSAKNQTVAIFSMQFMIAKNSPVFSHVVTARLSQKITTILKQNISPKHVLFHSSNLQFDLLIPHIDSALQLNLLAAKLGRAFEEMLILKDVSVLVTPICGGAFMGGAQTNISDVYTHAKSALESAVTKQQYFVMYSDEIKKDLQHQNDIENKVLEAFATDSLTLFFQPIVNIEHSTCAGAELLLRWSDGISHNIYPSVTIEILNKVGKGKLFTRWLINSACRYASELINEHKLPIYLTINLRAEDLYDIELPHLLLQAIALWKIKPQDIVLEITENGILEYNESSTSVIKTLSESGFRLALDDFGTGFSSLSRLRTMPIDLIKIDQSFVRDIIHSVDDFEIVKSIAMLANSLGKEVLAEGVEDKDCLDLIKQMKIHKCQGYYFAKPMPFEQFVIWTKQHLSS